MALHPRVQVRLIEYLKQKAEEKKIMIIISTHSPAMIKSMDSRNIILLDSNDDGSIEMCTPCYAARALGGIDYEDSKMFDYIFFVEDEMARFFLKNLLDKYLLLEKKHFTASTAVIPVGGFCQTAEMAVATRRQLFTDSKVFALVDDDAFDDIENKPNFKKLCDKYKNNVIFSLTVTPEVKFIEVFLTSNKELKKRFKLENKVDISYIVKCKEFCDCNSESERTLAKQQFGVFVDKCHETSGDSEQLVIDRLIKYVIDSFGDGEIKSILGPIFNKKR